MPHPLLNVSQSDSLIQVVHIIYSHTEQQTMQIQISWLLQKPTDLYLHCLQSREYLGSAGQELIKTLTILLRCTLCKAVWSKHFDRNQNLLILINPPRNKRRHTYIFSINIQTNTYEQQCISDKNASKASNGAV